MTNIIMIGNDNYGLKNILEGNPSYHVTNIDGSKDLNSKLKDTSQFDILILTGHCVLSDIFSITRTFHSIELDIPLIFISSELKEEDINTLIMSNVSSFLIPPVNPGELFFAVENAKKQSQAHKSKTEYERVYLDTVYKFQVLADIVKKANSSLERVVVVESIMAKVEEIIKCEGWSILLLNKEKDKLVFEASKGAIGKLLEGKEIPADAGIVGKVIRENTPVIINDAKTSSAKYNKIDDTYNFSTNSIICIPLKSQGITIGAIEIVNKKYDKLFNEKDLELLQILSEPAAIALENSFLYEKTKELSLIDDLTQLYNSRYLNQYLEKEIERAKRKKTCITMIFFDIDGFKEINDNYGHLAGSQALSEIGYLVKESIRKMDTAFRCGGDEYIIILPETATENSITFLKRFRETLNLYSFLKDMGININITASFGVSTFPDHSKTKEELISYTDSAMYYVKERGKDGIYVHNSNMIIR